MENSENPRYRLPSRVRVVSLILAFATALITFRLAEIQIFNADEYKKNATAAQWRTEIIPATRGTIYDANGTVIARSAQTWELDFYPERFNNEKFREAVCKDTAELLDLDYDELMELTAAEKSDDPDKPGKDAPVKIKSQMELSEKLLINCGKDGHKEGDPNVCLMHRKYTEKYTNSKGKAATRSYRYGNVMTLVTDSKRYYPMGEFASSIIGSVNADGNGVAGIEGYCNTLLSGKDGRKTTYGSNLDENTETLYEASDGVSLKLTIDENLQNILSENVKEMYETAGGIGAYGIMMDVKTGAILASESVAYKGEYDLKNPSELNDYYKAKLEKAVANDDFTDLTKYLRPNGDTTTAESDTADEEEKKPDPLDEIRNETDFAKRSALHSKTLGRFYMFEQWNNYITSETYHPGSVFKVFLASAALEENILEDDYRYTCIGAVSVEDRIFHCHYASGHGTQDLRHGLMNSCNPFFVKLGLKLGAEKFFEYFKAFGFTEKTGLETISEANPIYFKADDLSAVTLASESFGQTFSVTPIQVITALSSIANGGYLMQPYLIDEELDSEGNILKKTQPTVRRQVISESTASEIASMMEDVCISGTGRNGYVAGYRVAGKTGTTQKYQLSGTYIASFACFAPADDPEIALLLIVDEPVAEINGSTVCAPTAAKIMESSLEYLGVERQYTEQELQKLDTFTPGVVGSDVDSAVKKLEESGFSVRVIGTGNTVHSQSPAGGQTIPRGGVIAVYTTDNEEDKLEVTVPDLTGMSTKAVQKYAASEGLNVRISGNSNLGVISYEQSIEAGTTAEYGTIVTVYFKSYENIGDSTED